MNYPSQLLMNMGNIEGVNHLFTEIDKSNITLDKTLLFYGVRNKP